MSPNTICFTPTERVPSTSMNSLRWKPKPKMFACFPPTAPECSWLQRPPSHQNIRNRGTPKTSKNTPHPHQAGSLPSAWLWEFVPVAPPTLWAFIVPVYDLNVREQYCAMKSLEAAVSSYCYRALRVDWVFLDAHVPL